MKSVVEYRYVGKNPKNYVLFNNEMWRAIGVFEVENANGKFESRLKLVREEAIGRYSWDTSASNINTGRGISQWGGSGSYTGADLMRLLNPGFESESVNNSLYYNRSKGNCYTGINNTVTNNCDFTSTGLLEESKKLIDKAKWYLGRTERSGAPSYSYANAKTSYKEERSNNLPPASAGVTGTTNWIGYVGLIYPSDYGYASDVCSQKEFLLSDIVNTTKDYRNDECTSSNWIINGVDQWLLSPTSNSGIDARTQYLSGQAYNNETRYSVGVRPSLYLKSDVKIKTGIGTSTNPYQLKL